MSEDLLAREKELARLLAATRRAVADGAGQEKVRELREETERAFSQWRAATSLVLHQAVQRPVPRPELTAQSGQQGQPRTVREKVHAALLILQTPASPSLISRVYGAFHDDALSVDSMRSLRVDERNSHQATMRPFFVCAVLNTDLQAVKGYHASSTWPLEERTVTPRSAQLWQLKAVAHVAAAVQSVPDSGQEASQAQIELLRTMAVWANLPGADQASVESIEKMAHRSMRPLLAAHHAASSEVAASAKALSPAGQLFGKAAVRLTHAQTAALWGLARESAKRKESMDVAQPASAAAAPSPASGPASPAQASPQHAAGPSPQPGRAAAAPR
ncbi:hypothetical protein [Streptomyces sp. NPDC001165]|uniref:hypothetical protein n=1 Tax=Streptomyces sp. NPDC001165 TaxID=3364546 RepID=UPI0036A62923